MRLNRLTDDELLRYAHTVFDPRTGTALEAELLQRPDAATEALRALEPVTKAVDKSEFELDDLAQLFAVLEEFSAGDIKTLRQKLERADKGYGIAEEAGDLFQRLTDLTNTTL
jgi:hypothetical protein